MAARGSSTLAVRDLLRELALRSRAARTCDPELRWIAEDEVAETRRRLAAGRRGLRVTVEDVNDEKLRHAYARSEPSRDRAPAPRARSTSRARSSRLSRRTAIRAGPDDDAGGEPDEAEPAEQRALDGAGA